MPPELCRVNRNSAQRTVFRNAHCSCLCLCLGTRHRARSGTEDAKRETISVPRLQFQHSASGAAHPRAAWVLSIILLKQIGGPMGIVYGMDSSQGLSSGRDRRSAFLVMATGTVVVLQKPPQASRSLRCGAKVGKPRSERNSLLCGDVIVLVNAQRGGKWTNSAEICSTVSLACR